jgi:hypothetical protein
VAVYREPHSVEQLIPSAMSLPFKLLLRSEIPEYEASEQELRDAARSMRCRWREVSMKSFLIAPKVRAAVAYEEWFKALPVEVRDAAVPPYIREPEEYAVRVGPQLKIANPTSREGLADAAGDFASGFFKLYRPPHWAVIAVFSPAPDRPNQ